MCFNMHEIQAVRIVNKQNKGAAMRTLCRRILVYISQEMSTKQNVMVGGLVKMHLELQYLNKRQKEVNSFHDTRSRYSLSQSGFFTLKK